MGLQACVDSGFNGSMKVDSIHWAGGQNPGPLNTNVGLLKRNETTTVYAEFIAKCTCHLLP